MKQYGAEQRQPGWSGSGNCYFSEWRSVEPQHICRQLTVCVDELLMGFFRVVGWLTSSDAMRSSANEAGPEAIHNQHVQDRQLGPGLTRRLGRNSPAEFFKIKRESWKPGED